MFVLALIALASASCVCQNLSVADGCTATSGPYTACEYYNAEVNCNASACAYVKIAKASSCALLCDCAPFCSADLLQDNICQDQCNTASCFYDGGDCTTDTLTSCTSVEAYDYQVCVQHLSSGLDPCVYWNALLDCYRTTPCLSSGFGRYCSAFATQYTQCTFNCDGVGSSATTLSIAALLFQ